MTLKIKVSELLTIIFTGLSVSVKLKVTVLTSFSVISILAPIDDSSGEECTK